MAENFRDLPSTLRAVRYPLSLDGSGGLELSYGADCIRDEIISALETWQYERVMRPGYGLPMSLIFSAYPKRSVASERIRRTLEQALGSKYRGLSYSVSSEILSDGVVDVTVEWVFQGIPQPEIQYRFEE